jgi:hypothetical protein
MTTSARPGASCTTQNALPTVLKFAPFPDYHAQIRVLEIK